MGFHEMGLVGQRSRASKNELLLLLKIGDGTTEEGRDCYLETPAMARWLRSSERGAEYILQRLERDGEVEIEVNTEGRTVTQKYGRKFRPKWFIHVRCLCDWEAYQTETKPAKTSDYRAALLRGRPRRKSEKIAVLSEAKNPQSLRGNPQDSTSKSAKTDNAYKERTICERTDEQEQGQAGASGPLFPDSELTLDDYLPVVTKVVHEVLDDYKNADDGDLAELVKSRIARLNAGHNERSKIQYDSGLVTKAIESARWQRRNAKTGAA